MLHVCSDFFIHGWPINNFLSSSEASLHSDVGTVDLLVNSLSQSLGNNTSLAFKDDFVLYGHFISNIEVLGDFFW